MDCTITWASLVDCGPAEPPVPFDYEGYLNLLQRRNHNFIRLWAWGNSVGNDTDTAGQPYLYHSTPHPWLRTGPGVALDGKPKFDLTRLNEEYFDRLRACAIAAGKRNMYVSIMLFCAGYEPKSKPKKWDNEGSQFHKDNNINGINGDPTGKGIGYTFVSLDDPQITAIQEAYVRKVIDTVNDLDNVLYEVCNEAGERSIPWQYHMIGFLHECEKAKPKQHPVGMTDPSAWGVPTNDALLKSEAEWISPGHQDADDAFFSDAAPAADGRKVLITDSDHLQGLERMALLWKCCCRGMSFLYMDIDDNAETNEIARNPVRKSLGYARMFLERMNLAEAVPCNDLASTKYCLSDKKSRFLIFLPEGPKIQVNLSGAPGFFNVEWLNPKTGEIRPSGQIAGGRTLELTCPFPGEAVLYLWRR